MKPSCSVCVNSLGFYARPCLGCSIQRPCDIRHAKVYGVRVGERVTQAPTTVPPLPTAAELREVLFDVGVTGERWRQERSGRVFG